MIRPSHFQSFWLVYVCRMTMYLSIYLSFYLYIHTNIQTPSLLTYFTPNPISPATTTAKETSPSHSRIRASHRAVLCCAESAPLHPFPAPSFVSEPRRPSVRALDVASDMVGSVRTMERLDVIVLDILGTVKFGGKYYVNMYTRTTHAKAST